MDGYIVYGGMAMARGGLLRIEDGKGMLLYVWDGALWITQEGDRRDYFVAAGDCFHLRREGTTVSYAMRRSSVSVTAPVPAYYARRITRTFPGTRAAQVIYDRAQEPGGRIAGARRRLARFRANAPIPQ
jgi:Protein of unknown function (DUF2917)